MNTGKASKVLKQSFSLVLLLAYLLSTASAVSVKAQAPIGENRPPLPAFAAPVIAQGESVHVRMSEEGNNIPFELRLDISSADENSTYNWQIKSQAGHGVAQVNSTGSSVVVTYKPEPGFAGQDAFLVQVSNGLTDQILVQVTVDPAVTNESSKLDEGLTYNQGPLNERINPSSLFEGESLQPYIKADVSINILQFFDWFPNTTLSINLKYPSDGSVVDFSDTVDTDNNGYAQYVPGLYKPIPGMTINVTDGVTTKQLVVSSMRISNVNPAADIVSGTAEIGKQIYVYASENSGPGFEKWATTDASGQWSADFSGTFDINAGSYGWAFDFDNDGDSTAFYWEVRNPIIEVSVPYAVYSYNWISGTEISVTIDDPSNGIGTDYASSEIADSSGWVDFFPTSDMFKPGNIVELTDGSITKSHTITSLEIQKIDLANDTLYGIAEPGSVVQTKVSLGRDYTELAGIADSTGNWSVNYGTLSNPVDFTYGWSVRASQTDDDGDKTYVNVYLKTPVTGVNLSYQTVSGGGWAKGMEVTLTIDDPSNGSGIDYSESQVSEGGSDSVGFSPVSFELKPGQIVKLSDGTLTKTLVTTNLKINLIDADTDIVTGTAEPDSEITVFACDSNCYGISLTADPTGFWSVNFSTVLQPYDITNDSQIYVDQYDDDLDWTEITKRILNPNIGTLMTSNLVFGNEWNLGSTVTITIDDPVNGAGVDYTATESVTGNEAYSFFNHWVSGFQIKSGQVISVTDGVLTRTMTVSNLSITNIDLDTDIVTGTGTPGLNGFIYTWSGFDTCSVAMVIDQFNQWTADFSQTCGLEFGAYLDSYQIDTDQNITEIYLEIIQPVAQSTSPASILVNGPEFTLIVNGSGFDASSVVQWNGKDRPTTFVNNNQLTASISAADITAIGTALITVRNPLITGAIFPNVSFTIYTFADVIPGTWYYGYVEGFYAKGITTGCNTGPLRYCPDRAVTRAEMAVFILRSQHADALPYTPNPDPSVIGAFSDVPVAGKEWMQPWIEEFYQTGMTTGCNNAPLSYCPERQVTRAEMAVFVLRAVHGKDYVPPAATGVFSDVPVSGKEWMQPWIEQFYREGITTGCAQSPLRYCPEQSVTRAEMATFLDRAFGFPQFR